MNEEFPVSAKQLHKYIANQLTAIYDRKEADNIAKVLLIDLFRVNQIRLALNDKVHFSDEEKNALAAVIKRLLNHEPVQYVCEKAWFYGYAFRVNQQVLIPRPETEELVKWVLESPLKQPKILDVGAGSGCIAISLALEFPEANVDAIEVSRGAIELAAENATDNNARVNFLPGDVLAIEELPATYDIIVSNPPYIPESEIKDMQRNVANYEPREALFVSNNDPLIFYRKIAKLSAKGLSKSGLLYYEIHEGKGPEIKEMLEEMNFINVEIKKDLQGKERMIKAQMGSQI